MRARSGPGARPPAVRWPLVALLGLVGAAVLGSWLPGRAAGQGVSPVADTSCPARLDPAGPPAADYPPRQGRDRLLLPAAYQAAPVTTLRCRYGADGTLAAASELDAARTARLTALLAAPPDGWPDDALAAKRMVPWNDTALDAAAAPECSTPAPADWLVFRFPEGPDAAVLVRGAPCGDAGNGMIRLRTPPGVADDLAALARS